MGVVIPVDRFRRELREAFDSVPGSSVAFHTALFPLGLLGGVRSRDQLLADYLSLIQECAGDRILLFPAFNYDFCKSGVYRPNVDPCQVGPLNEHVRQRYPDSRTLTPVFNFVCVDDAGGLYGRGPCENPFGEESTFAELVRNKACIVLFGAGLDANTLIHHVEEQADIGYRYHKVFEGGIELEDRRQDARLLYRVRCLDVGGKMYDWERLAADLLAKGILRRFPLGNGWFQFFRADVLREYWCERLAEDEMYLLRPDYCRTMKQLYAKFGYPLTFEKVEGAERVRRESVGQ